jgi:hypothetical protein
MAKVQMPLHSITAKGSIARGSLTFSSRNNRTVGKYVPTWKKGKSASQLTAQNFFILAQKYWSWLPDYAVYYWNSTSFTQPAAYDNSPWRAVIKGKNLFFRQAVMRIKKGLRPKMTPYDDGLARTFYDVSPWLFFTE